MGHDDAAIAGSTEVEHFSADAMPAGAAAPDPFPQHRISETPFETRPPIDGGHGSIRRP